MSESYTESIPITWSGDQVKDGNLDPSVVGSQAVRILDFLSNAVNAMFVTHQTHDVNLFNSYFEHDLQLGVFGNNYELDASPKSIQIEHASTLSGSYITQDLHIRARLSITTITSDNETQNVKIFLDLASVQDPGYTVLANCPNCGAPITLGSHMCSYCNVDVRVMKAKTFKVIKIQYY